MSDTRRSLPLRLQPYLAMNGVDQPLPVSPGPITLGRGAESIQIDSDLTFQWSPTVSIVFEADCPGQWRNLFEGDWRAEFPGAPVGGVPCVLTNVNIGPAGSRVKGAIKGELAMGNDSFERLRFSITNFPSYLGVPVGTDDNGSWARCRIVAESALGSLTVDEVEGADSLRREAQLRRGLVVTHVGEWVPMNGPMTATDARETLRMLHFWFAFLAGGWCGPVFAQGLTDGAVRWRHYARWKLTEGKNLVSWLPHATPVDVQDAFAGFVARWQDPAWQGPVISAISWLMEANHTKALEAKTVLAQVALELLSWVWVVETERLHSRGDFDRLSAAGKIRALLHHARVPVVVPDYLSSLTTLTRGDAFDGPGVATTVRNSLVHAHEANRARAGALSGEQLRECADLSLQYVELVLLAVCGHSMHYARRGWKGWQGDDEVVVPWAG